MNVIKINEICDEFNLRLHSIDDKYIRITNAITNEELENIAKETERCVTNLGGNYNSWYDFHLNQYINYRLDIDIKHRKFRLSTHYKNSTYISFEDLKIINKIIEEI